MNLLRSFHPAPSMDFFIYKCAASLNSNVGAILNYGSSFGREEEVAMEMAIGDINNLTNQALVLHTMDSNGDPFLAVSAGEKLQSNLSRLAMVVWLFAALVLTSNYTATLSSILTTRRLEPSLVDIDSLKSSNAVVGCNTGSVVGKYLENVLGFQRRNIKLFTSGDDYFQALKNGDIKAAFLRIPHANILVSKHCFEVISAGPIFQVGGLGFVFPKGSPLLSVFSETILKFLKKESLRN
ncbi:glutamate receptor 2.8-like isoform X3 [Dioscorea cayenensis subsp. rotundata]|uniref:Glutamate receptor 2.8-like isoform X3 n=1 Tax=Dioscorea cayennensis subsp. rotundata TaxID=55577 RepID=A0AB40CS23_DIOCR|nr:glutamate receptor 2.8-like isoform X3 [Dioscorea cayenensis subsp. rotundata]